MYFTKQIIRLGYSQDELLNSQLIGDNEEETRARNITIAKILNFGNLRNTKNYTTFYTFMQDYEIGVVSPGIIEITGSWLEACIKEVLKSSLEKGNPVLINPELILSTQEGKSFADNIWKLNTLADYLSHQSIDFYQVSLGGNRLFLPNR
jgi:hypothetical protein